MMAIEINVRVEGGNGGYIGPTVAMRIRGEDDDNFLDAIAARIAKDQGADVLRSTGLYGITWSDPDYPAYLMQEATHLTFAHVRDYFGREIDADPPTIGVDDGGYGGDDGYWFTYGIDIVKGVAEVVGYVGMGLAAQRLLAKARFAGRRQLVKDWNDSGGVISPELRDLIYNEGDWNREDFDRIFALGESRGPELLHQLGYERRDNEAGVEMWVRDPNLDEGAG